MVKEGFTELVEGNTFGNMEARVVVSPPTKNRVENIKPVPSFLNDFILNKPNKPARVMSGKSHNQICSVKL